MFRPQLWRCLPSTSRGLCSNAQTGLLPYVTDLERRNLIRNTYPGKLVEQFSAELRSLPPVIYCGFDPTANSLHIGNLLVLINLLRGRKFGLRPIAIVGGGTGCVGDPSGRTTERPEIERHIVLENAVSIENQIRIIAENTSEHGESLNILNNLEWLSKMDAIDFGRACKLQRRGELDRVAAVKSRMMEGDGISVCESLYPAYQAIDWLQLARNHECFFQIGGSDQLGHLDFGAHYIKRSLDGKFAAGLCLPLVTDSAGNKLGKSVGGGVWLNASKTSPFHFYQFFRQLHDTEAEMFLPQFSLKSVEEVKNILNEHRANLGRWVAQDSLATEITRLVHGQSGLDNALSCTRALFHGSMSDVQKLSRADLLTVFGNTIEIPRSDVRTYGDLANRTRTDKQKGRILMTKGAFKINGEKCLTPDVDIDFGTIVLSNAQDLTLICWGKRNFQLVKWLS